MVPYRNAHSLQAEQVGEITVVTFQERELLEERAIQDIAEQLLSLADQLDRRCLVLNLASVERLSTAMFGQLMGLNKKVRAAGGRLALCRMHPEFRDICRLLRLPELFPIYREEQEALQALFAKSSAGNGHNGRPLSDIRGSQTRLMTADERFTRTAHRRLSAN